MKLYKAKSGIIHTTLGGYICIQSMGKVNPNMTGDRDDVTCKLCRSRWALE